MTMGKKWLPNRVKLNNILIIIRKYNKSLLICKMSILSFFFALHHRFYKETGKNSSVPPLGWSILYWGVEYKSRQTGPFSTVTKSKDVPFEVGTACGSSLKKKLRIRTAELGFVMESHECNRILPDKDKQGVQKKVCVIKFTNKCVCLGLSGHFFTTRCLFKAVTGFYFSHCTLFFLSNALMCISTVAIILPPIHVGHEKIPL